METARKKTPPRMAGRISVATAALTAVWLAAYAATALAAGTSAGMATVVNPDNTSAAVTGGGSQTWWTLKLPTGAACSGDTAGTAYHVYGYVVSATSDPDPGTLTFNSDGPVGTGTVFPLYDASASPYVNSATEITTGKVINVPAFSWSLFSVDGRTTTGNPDGTLVLPLGTYNVGVACAHANGTGDTFWNVQMTFVAAAGDANGATWSVPGGTSTSSSTTPSSTTSSTTPTSSSTSPTTSSTTSSTTSTTSRTSTTSTTPTTTSTSSTTSTTVAPDSTTATTTGSATGAQVLGASITAPDPASAGGSTLPRTGSSPARPLLLATGLAYLGYVVVLVARRRRWGTVARLLEQSDPES